MQAPKEITSQKCPFQYSSREKAARLQRSQVIERFILTLSDQQLVTGLGILIAGYKGLCTISFYNMNIITAIAWFSSTTHLSTLAILRGYLIDHPRIRNWRAAAMLLLFALLVVAQLAIAAPAEFCVPAQCLFYSWTYGESYRPLGIPFVGTIIIVLFLIASYTSRIARLYSPDPEWTLQIWLARAVFRKDKQLSSVERAAIAVHAKTRSEMGTAFRKIRYQRRLAQYLEAQKVERSPFRYRLREIMFVNQEIQRSFVGELQALLFGVSFGVTQLLYFRGLLGTPHHPGVDYLVGDENTIGFGQLVPLLLILLPIFAAGEAFDGKLELRWGPRLITNSCEHTETARTSALSNEATEERTVRIQYQNFWHHELNLSKLTRSTPDQPCHAQGVPLSHVTVVPAPLTGETHVENASQDPPHSSVQSQRTTSPEDPANKATIPQSRLWITVSSIIAGRTILMALYGVTFAGVFSFINPHVGDGALAMAAFFCGGMMLLEFVYLLRNSRHS